MTESGEKGVLAAIAALITGGFTWLRTKENKEKAAIDKEKAAIDKEAAADQLDTQQLKILVERLAQTESRSNRLEEKIERQSGRIVHLENEKLELERQIDSIESASKLHQARADLAEAHLKDLLDQAARKEGTQ